MADKHNITDALIFLGDLVVYACHTAVADPGFQTGGANPIIKEGAPTYILPKKKHDREGGASLACPLPL